MVLKVISWLDICGYTNVLCRFVITRLLHLFNTSGCLILCAASCATEARMRIESGNDFFSFGDNYNRLFENWIVVRRHQTHPPVESNSTNRALIMSPAPSLSMQIYLLCIFLWIFVFLFFCPHVRPALYIIRYQSKTRSCAARHSPAQPSRGAGVCSVVMAGQNHVFWTVWIHRLSHWSSYSCTPTVCLSRPPIPIMSHIHRRSLSCFLPHALRHTHTAIAM